MDKTDSGITLDQVSIEYNPDNDISSQESQLIKNLEPGLQYKKSTIFNIEQTNNHSHINDRRKRETMDKLLLKTRTVEGLNKIWHNFVYNVFKYSYYIQLSSFYMIFLNIIILVSLFLDSIRIAFMPKQADIYIDILIFIFQGIYVADIVLNILQEKDYFYSYQFYLDLFITILISFDTQIVENKVFYNRFEDRPQIIILLSIMQILRNIRLLRILKIIKRDIMYQIKGILMQKAQGDEEREQIEQSKIQQLLKQQNTKSILVIIIIVMIAVPLLNNESWFPDHGIDLTYFLEAIVPLYISNPDYANIIRISTDKMFLLHHQELIQFQINNDYFYLNPESQSFRKMDLSLYQQITIVNSYNYDILMVYSNKFRNKIQAIFDIAICLFIIITLLVSLVSIQNDLLKLILRPLNQMIEKIKQISNDPFSVLQQEHNSDKQNEENKLIQKASLKISQLLILGFGQSGSRLISNFLKDQYSIDDFMNQKAKMFCVFLNVNIRSITVFSQHLQTNITLFINTIADIIHNSVDKYGGMIVKNADNNFLLVWNLLEYNQNDTNSLQLSFEDKITKQEKGQSKQNIKDISEEQRILNNPVNKQIVELVLISVIEMIYNIQISDQLNEYYNIEEIREKIYSSKPRIGCGLHLGWAHEAACGSQYKIDINYISNAVDVSQIMMQSCKVYGQHIIFSQKIYNMIYHKEIQNQCWLIDKISLNKNNKQKYYLIYTLDLNLHYLDFVKGLNMFHRSQSLLEPVKKEIQKQVKIDILKGQNIDSDYTNQELKKLQIQGLDPEIQEQLIQEKINSDLIQHILYLRDKNIHELKEQFNNAFEKYQKGEWAEAKQIFHQILQQKPDDIPSIRIINFINKNKKPKENWNGSQQNSNV